MIGGCSSLKISLAVLSAGHLFRMYSNVPIYQFHASETLRSPPASSYFFLPSSRRRRATCYIYRLFILFRGRFRGALFHLRYSRVFHNLPSQSSGRANLSEDRSRIALFIRIRTFLTIFSKYRTSDVARTSLYKSCILLIYRCTVIRYRK